MWTDDDVEYALAWQALKDEACPGCGHPRSETFHPDNIDAYDAKALKCFACEAREHKSRDWQEGGGDSAGLFFSVTKVRGDR